jgi:hypothetical protein
LSKFCAVKLFCIYRTVELSEPACTAKLSNEELISMAETWMEPPNFPLHAQSVERAVKLTTEVSSMAVDLEKRNQLALGKTLSRKIRPSFKSKKEYALDGISYDRNQ